MTYYILQDEPEGGGLSDSSGEDAAQGDPLHNIQPNPDNPPNPDESLSSSDPESSDPSEESSSEEEEAAEGENFNLNDVNLDAELLLMINPTARDAVALMLAVCTRYNLPHEALYALLRGQNALLGYAALPDDKRKLWRTLQKNLFGIKFYAYCSNCLSDLGLLNEEDFPDQEICGCGTVYFKKTVKYYIKNSLVYQVRRFLATRTAGHHLGYRENRVKFVEGNLEDLMDGAAYRQLQEEGQPLHNRNNYSFLLNADGFALFDSGTVEAWPVFVRINEVSPKMRQKVVFLAGLWVDEKKPNFCTFLRPIIEEMNFLSQTGIMWTPDGGEERCSKFFPTCIVADAKGRNGLLHMTDCVGHYSCSICTHMGVSFGRGPVKFPLEPDPPFYDFPEPVLRTDAGMRAAMYQAVVNEDRVEGHIGLTPFVNLHGFNLAVNQTTDNLHPWFEGVVRTHMQHFLKRDRPYSIPTAEIENVNKRLVQAVTPTSMSRKPRPLSKIAKWKGSELRNWLFNYSVPCMMGKLPRIYLDHWSLLAHAGYLLHKNSISPADLNEANRCITQYVTEYEQHFGPEKMFFNFHMIQHSVRCTIQWGPMPFHSTMPFESWNFRLLKLVKSPKKPIDQIVMRYQIVSLVNSVSLNEDIEPGIREEVDRMMMPYFHKRVVTEGGVHYLGPYELRPATNEELQILGHQVDCEHMQEFKRALFNSIEFRCPTYNPGSRSNNTWIFTFDGRYCKIESIVIVHDLQEHQHCGMFVRQLNVLERATNAPHIAKVTESDIVDFISFRSVQSLCVRVKVFRHWYMSPFPYNNVEID